MTKLLNIDSNAKTVKGQKHGFMTGVMYLAPYKTAGVNVCPTAELAGCWATCLNTAGRGGMPIGGYFKSPGGIMLPNNPIQHARIWRTKLWAEDQLTFWPMLAREIEGLQRKAKRADLVPVVRLNGTSDILWERERGMMGATVFEAFPDIQFYDYTKLPARLSWSAMPGNYHLTVSYSERSPLYAKQCQKAYENGASIVAVVKDQALKDRYLELGAVDMDEHDLRFLNPPGSIGVLKAKGSAKKETNGFVLQEMSPWVSSALAKSSQRQTHSRVSRPRSSPLRSSDISTGIGEIPIRRTPYKTIAPSRRVKTA